MSFLSNHHLRSVPHSPIFTIDLVSLWFSRLGATLAGFFFCLVLGQSAAAQYALTETGARLSVGVITPYGAERWQVGPSLALGGFLTHYLCGKKSGYWFEASLQQHFFIERAGTSPSLLRASATSENQYTLLNFQLAALYKFRPVNYHRPREWAFLFGPKLDLSLNPRVAAGNEGYINLSDSTDRSVRFGWLGVHLGTVYRRPMLGQRRPGSKPTSNSLLFFAGLDWYPIALAERGPARLQALVITVGIGATIWDNR